MYTLRVHAGPHRRYVCPLAVEPDIDPEQPVLLFQEPGHRPRACQLEATAKGSRLWWIARRLRAGETRDYQLILSQRKNPRIRLRWEALGVDQLRLTSQGQPLAVYDYQAANPFPTLALFLAENGVEHAVAKRLQIAGETVGQGHCRTRTKLASQPVEGPVFAQLISQGYWYDQRNEPILEEVVTYTFYTTPADIALIDVIITLQASLGPVTLRSDAPGGLLSMELAEEQINRPDFRLMNSNGAVGQEEIDGQRANWCQAEGSAGIAVFDYPQNFGSPCSWRIDEQRILKANPFTLTEASQTERCSLATGESVTFRYRLYLLGPEQRHDAARQRYADYAFPPRLEVVPHNTATG